jgi:hypothetical protein
MSQRGASPHCYANLCHQRFAHAKGTDADQPRNLT